MRNPPLRSACFSLILLGACGGTEPTTNTGNVHTASTATGSSAPAVAASSAAAAGAPADETKVVKVDVDTPMTTPSGSTYIAPKGWTVTTKKDVIALTDPNREVSVTFLERKEQDGAAAIAAAWKQVQPDFARTITLTT